MYVRCLKPADVRSCNIEFRITISFQLFPGETLQYKRVLFVGTAKESTLTI